MTFEEISLRLPQLPDRKSVKLTISIWPELHEALNDYAELYRQAYGTQENTKELIPFILEAFLNADAGYKKARRKLVETRQAEKEMTYGSHRNV